MSEDFLNENNSENLEEAQDVSDASSEAVVSEQNETESKIKEPKPRKRKIVKNNSILIIAIIFLVLLLTTVIWKLFFEKTIVGTWSFINTYTATETYDSAESADTPDSVETEYSQRVVYEFTDDGECIVTVGSITVPGEYYLYTDDDGNRIVSAYVVYSYTPLFYGSFTYEIKGNVFTGKKLIIYDSYDDVSMELEPGEGEDPLVPFEDFIPNEQLYGEWYNEESGLTYTFDEDGYMALISDDGIIFEHVYTTMEDYDVILVKYYGQEENSESYTYSVEDDVLTLNGLQFTKVE